MRVAVASGKYTFVQRETPPCTIDVLRHGEPWIENLAGGNGFNAIYSLLAELDAARVVLQAARDLGDDAPVQIKDALARHAGLVDDHEKPSPWAVP